MGIITTTVKWSVKLGLAGGSIYVANQAGLFGTADQAEQGLKQLKTDVAQLPKNLPQEVRDVVPEVPKVEFKDLIPDLPKVDFSPDVRGLWNKAVLFTFSGLANAPQATKTYAGDVVQYLQNQLEEGSKK